MGGGGGRIVVVGGGRLLPQHSFPIGILQPSHHGPVSTAAVKFGPLCNPRTVPEVRFWTTGGIGRSQYTFRGAVFCVILGGHYSGSKHAKAQCTTAWYRLNVQEELRSHIAVLQSCTAAGDVQIARDLARQRDAEDQAIAKSLAAQVAQYTQRISELEEFLALREQVVPTVHVLLFIAFMGVHRGCASGVRNVGYFGPIFPDSQGDRSNVFPYTGPLRFLLSPETQIWH